MLKYKDTYRVKREKDKDENPSSNRQDTYIPCANKIQIYRFNEDTLIVYFHSNGVANNRIKALSKLGITLTPYQIGDDERTYKFAESDLDKIADVVKAKKRIRRELTDEKRNELRERLMNYRKNSISKNDTTKD
jgi:hypothetical protein